MGSTAVRKDIVPAVRSVLGSLPQGKALSVKMPEEKSNKKPLLVLIGLSFVDFHRCLRLHSIQVADLGFNVSHLGLRVHHLTASLRM